eukprot:4995994-Lingulodinium_polyedra.AAC.1
MEQFKLDNEDLEQLAIIYNDHQKTAAHIRELRKEAQAGPKAPKEGTLKAFQMMRIKENPSIDGPLPGWVAVVAGRRDAFS